METEVRVTPGIKFSNSHSTGGEKGTDCRTLLYLVIMATPEVVRKASVPDQRMAEMNAKSPSTLGWEGQCLPQTYWSSCARYKLLLHGDTYLAVDTQKIHMKCFMQKMGCWGMVRCSGQ